MPSELQNYLDDYFLDTEIASRIHSSDSVESFGLVARLLLREEKKNRPQSRWASMHYDIHFEQKMWV